MKEIIRRIRKYWMREPLCGHCIFQSSVAPYCYKMHNRIIIGRKRCRKFEKCNIKISRP